MYICMYLFAFCLTRQQWDDQTARPCPIRWFKKERFPRTWLLWLITHAMRKTSLLARCHRARNGSWITHRHDGQATQDAGYEHNPYARIRLWQVQWQHFCADVSCGAPPSPAFVRTVVPQGLHHEHGAYAFYHQFPWAHLGPCKHETWTRRQLVRTSNHPLIDWNETVSITCLDSLQTRRWNPSSTWTQETPCSELSLRTWATKIMYAAVAASEERRKKSSGTLACPYLFQLARLLRH